jgi:hypothetical protein
VAASTTRPSRDASEIDGDASSLETDHEARLREHAYLLAESNHFAGDPSFYWRVAERELARSERFDAPSTARPRGAHAETR